MKNYILKILIVITFILTISCDKEKTPSLYKSYGIAYTTSEGNYKLKIKTDLGNIIIPNNSNIKIDDSSRVYLQFSFLNDSDKGKDSILGDIYSVTPLLYKEIIDTNTTIEEKPVYVKYNTIWISSYTNTLNIPFEYLTDGGEHTVNLFYNKTLSSNDTIVLDFKHNYYRYGEIVNRGFVSFDLNSLKKYTTVKESTIYKIQFNNEELNNTGYSYIKEWFGTNSK